MPETTKLEGREEGVNETQDLGGGVETEALHPAESSSFVPEARRRPLAEIAEPEASAQPHEESPEPGASPDPFVEIAEPEANAEPLEESPETVEAPHELPPEIPEEINMREFAETVMSGLEQAGIKIDDEAPQEASVPQSDGASLPDDEEGFFAGWDGLIDEQNLANEEEPLDEQDDEAVIQPFEEIAGLRSLSEISLASGASAEVDEAGASDAEASAKHDELADAVQSALANVYGNPSSASARPPAAPADAAFALPPEILEPDAGWTTPEAAASSDDNLSPQDVILNYFNYDPNAQNGDVRSPGAVMGAPGYDDAFGPRDEYRPAQHQSQWPGSLAQSAAYDGEPAYPVPAGFTAEPTAATASERESSRLLGAAAIGLVGGIAIAASLAVFVISSYGPGVQTGAGANRALDASEPGYGRRPRGEGEIDTSRNAAETPAAEEPALIAASDIVATPGQPSALAIGVKPERSAEQTLISITGVPDGARLNAGVDAGGGNWLLPPRRLNGLTINLPAGASDTLLGVQLLDSNVRTPLSEKKQFAVRVASAKPEPATFIAGPQSGSPDGAAFPEIKPVQAFAAPSFNTQTVPAPAAARIAPPQPQQQTADLSFRTQTIPAPASQPAALQRQPAFAPGKGASQTEIEDLIREGNKRMREGDILEARQLYQKAVMLGDPEAALAMGRSYDPIYFARIDRKNAEPDAAKAFDWYRRAMDGGASQTAKVRIENLKHFLNE
jgi:hypothetical protein